MSNPPEPIEVFFACAPEDELLRKELEKHLSQLYRGGLINIWHRFSVTPGTEVDKTLVRHLNKAPIILLLISADFMASDDCYKIEMPYAMQRHEYGTARVIPILLQPVDWQDAPFGNLQPLPSNGVPITSWSNPNEAFAHVVGEFREIIKNLAGIESDNTDTGPINLPDRERNLVARTRGTVTKTAVARWVIIAIIAAIVLGTSGVLAFHPFHLFLAQPEISITSKYHVQGLPVGADGTSFHVSGQHFAANSAITFLLDNIPLNEAQQTQSDDNGNVTTDLAVTSAWSIGQHTLTAHNAGNAFSTQIDIVQAGESNTPGPGGAPSDDASFTLQANGQATNTLGTTTFFSYPLTVTGHPDPAGGSVCTPRDNGTPISDQLPTNGGVTLYRTSTYACNGTYKGGKLSYSETLQMRTSHYSNGIDCTLNAPIQSYVYITGSYTNQHDFSGNLTESSIDVSMFTCTPAGSTAWLPAAQGTWTGTVGQS